MGAPSNPAWASLVLTLCCVSPWRVRPRLSIPPPTHPLRSRMLRSAAGWMTGSCTPWSLAPARPALSCSQTLCTTTTQSERRSACAGLGSCAVLLLPAAALRSAGLGCWGVQCAPWQRRGFLLCRIAGGAGRHRRGARVCTLCGGRGLLDTLEGARCTVSECVCV